MLAHEKSGGIFVNGACTCQGAISTVSYHVDMNEASQAVCRPMALRTRCGEQISCVRAIDSSRSSLAHQRTSCCRMLQRLVAGGLVPRVLPVSRLGGFVPFPVAVSACVDGSRIMIHVVVVAAGVSFTVDYSSLSSAAAAAASAGSVSMARSGNAGALYADALGVT